MKDNDKVTLTYGQLKQLVKESKRLNKTSKTQVNEDLNAWKKADRQLGPAKKEIAKKAVELAKEMQDKFITQIGKLCIKNKLSYHSDRPQDAARQMWWDIVGDELSASSIAREMYRFDDGSFD